MKMNRMYRIHPHLTDDSFCYSDKPKSYVGKFKFEDVNGDGKIDGNDVQ